MKNKQREYRISGLVGGLLCSAVACLVALVFVAGIAQAQDGAAVRFSAGSSGGSVSGESFTLNSVIGQSIGGSVQNSGSVARLCSGFQCGQVAAVQETPATATPVPDEPATATPVPDEPATATPVPDEPATATPVPDEPATATPVAPTPVGGGEVFIPFVSQ